MLGNLTASQAGTNSPPTLDHLSPGVGRGVAIGPYLLSLTFNWSENLSLRSRWLSPSLAVPSLVGLFSGHPTSPSHPTSQVLRLCSHPLPRPSSGEGKPYRVTASHFPPIGRKRIGGRALQSDSESRDWLRWPLSRPLSPPGAAGVGWVGGYKAAEGRRHSLLSSCFAPFCFQGPVAFG